MQNLHLIPLSLAGLLLLGSISLQAQAEPGIQDSLTGLKFVNIPAGQFVMGTTELSEAIADLPDPKAAMIKDETPAHNVVFENHSSYHRQKSLNSSG